MSKYNARKVELDGFRFDSKHEAERYLELRALVLAGQAQDLLVHPRYRLEVNGQHVCDYVADFAYCAGGRLVVEDVKSPATRKLPAYRLKRKLMRALLGIEVQEVE